VISANFWLKGFCSSRAFIGLPCPTNRIGVFSDIKRFYNIDMFSKFELLKVNIIVLEHNNRIFSNSS